MKVSSVKNLNGETFSAVQDAALTDVVQTNSGNWQDITAYQNASAGYITAVDLSNYYTKSETSGADEIANALSNIPTGNPEVESYVQTNSANIDETVTSYQTNSGDWEDTTDVVQTNSASWGTGSTPTYDYTENDLISAIDTSGLYATSAGTADTANAANRILTYGTMGGNIEQSYNSNNFYYMPITSPFGKPQGIFSPLQYATGACLAMSGGSFGAYYKGNEWYVSNPNIGQMLRGEVHQSRGVHISGATTSGDNFNLGVRGVSGKVSGKYDDTKIWKLEYRCVSGFAGSAWRYGVEEDTVLRTVSALEYNAIDEISGIAGSAIAQPSLSSLNTAAVNNIVVTASLPDNPDANTLYLIPET